jgi:predicted Ser/Thr protein kinase
MSELGDTFKALHEYKKEKKANNIDGSLSLLESMGVEHKVLSYNNHHTLVVGRIDFWPSTGKWIDRKTKRYGRGIRKLLNYLKTLSV